MWNKSSIIQSEITQHRKRGDKVTGEKILKLRKRAKLTQDELARKVNVSRFAVTAWESGKATPRSDKIKPLSKALKCKVTDLI